ncbi:two-component system response regulator EvgA [Kluyvera sp. 1366]|jgi:two-component system response regulator EvgA
MLKILLVDDHPVVRFAVRMLLEKGGLNVVGETNNGIDAIQMARQLQPDVILLDIGLPKVDGFQVIDRLRNETQQIKILVLTSQGTSHFALRCQRAGANGFVTKTEDLTGLVEAVNVVGRGYNYFPQADYLDKSQEKADIHQEEATIIRHLSDREMSVLVGLASGLSNKEISLKLVLSEKTISTYKHRLKSKLNARTIIDLIDFARRNQLLD